MYAVNVSDSNRILRVTDVMFADANSIIVDEIPTGETEKEKDIANWIYVDGEYVYDPLQEIQFNISERIKKNNIEDIQKTLSEMDEAICTLYELILEE